MRRSTIIYVLLFAILLGAVYYLNKRQESADIAVTPEATPPPIEYLIQPEDGIPSRIYIEAKSGEVVEVARNEENAWALILPEEAPADQGSVEAAASQVATMRILERLNDITPEVVGLDAPDYIIKLGFAGGLERNIEIGVLTPTERGYYARGEDGKIVIISKSSVDPLLGLLTAPPYAPPTEAPTLTTP